MSTSHPTAFPYCTYCRLNNSGTMQHTIECFKAAGNHNSNFDPWSVCIHSWECIVVTWGIPHFYPSQCSPIKAIYHLHLTDWSLSSAMESVELCTQQLEQALTIISHGATSSQMREWYHGIAGMHSRELWGHMQKPNDGVRQTSWGQIRGQRAKDGGWWASGGQIE